MLKMGQVLYDNDPRYRGRKIEFVRIEKSYAICSSGPRQVKVRLDRIFGDGKLRRSGYSTIQQNDPAPDPLPPSGAGIESRPEEHQ
jgi:hypothetical protein